MPWDIANDFRTRIQHYDALAGAAFLAERLFRQYFEIQGERFKKANIPYRGEIAVKLEQLIYIFQQGSASATRMVADWEESHFHELQIQKFYAEAFYWFAWRTRQAFDFVPGLKSFDCPLVRNIRNRLMEHPEKGAGFATGNFIIGEGGPIVRPPPKEKLAEWDQGLFPNATEYFDNMIGMLERAVVIARQTAQPAIKE
jgi:hypothetical protein